LAPRIIESIAITDPVADPEIAVDETFTFEITATTSGSGTGYYDLYFEYDNGTNQAEWFSIPASGGGLTCPAPNPIFVTIEQENGLVNSKTVTGKVADTYYIRGRSIDYNDLEAEDYTDVQVVTVSAGGYEFLCTGSGGATTGGTATIAWTGDYVKAGSGGAITSGLAALFFGFILAATGGAATDGTAGFLVGHNYAGAGGGTSSGSATVLYQYDYAETGAGGAATDGAGTVSWTADFIEASSGGAITDGNADLAWTADYTETGSGGATTGGAADVVMPEGYEFLCTGTGGAATSGAAGFEFDYVLSTSGGAVASGSADAEYGHVYATLGGATASGGADYNQVWTVTATGGGTTSGAAEYSVGHNWIASGSATISGAADLVFGYIYVGVGGAQTSGEAGVEVIAYEFEHIASGGAITGGTALHVRYLAGGTGVDHQYKSAYRLRDSESADRGGIWHSNKFCNIESTARKRDWQSSYRAKE